MKNQSQNAYKIFNTLQHNYANDYGFRFEDECNIFHFIKYLKEELQAEFPENGPLDITITDIYDDDACSGFDGRDWNLVDEYISSRQHKLENALLNWKECSVFLDELQRDLVCHYWNDQPNRIKNAIYNYAEKMKVLNQSYKLVSLLNEIDCSLSYDLR